MQKIEGLLHSAYIYFSSSPKKHFEHYKLVKLLETKGNKLQCNVMTTTLYYDPKSSYMIYFKSFVDLMDCKANGLLIAW